MPAVSARQNRYIHAQANKGVEWARRFIAHSHGKPVPKRRKRRLKS